MASESSEDHNSLEERIIKLKQEAEKYDNLEDTVKIQQSEQYNQMIAEREACEEILENYKTVLITDTKKKKMTVCDDKTFNKYMEQIHEIKQKIEQNVPLDDLVDLYVKFNDAKVQIDAYLNSKKLVIKTL